MITYTVAPSIKIGKILQLLGCSIADCIGHNGKLGCEVGGELPRRTVEDLQDNGAEVLVYRQRGVVSTVVTF